MAEVSTKQIAQVSVRAEPGGPMHGAVEEILGFALPASVGLTTGAGSHLGPVPGPVSDAASGADSGPASGSEGGAWTALWLGPDEFLLCGPELPASGSVSLPVSVTEPLPAMVGELTGLSSSRTGERGLVVDVSAQRTVIELRGADARDLLEGGVPVDLHPRSFSPGMAVTTTLAKIPVLLWQTGESAYRLLPRTSFSGYLVRWLESAPD